MSHLIFAEKFAIGCHESIDQRRKYTLEPYWFHCRNVAYLVSLVTNDTDVIAAAWLHDVVEDVVPKIPALCDELARCFNERVIKLVMEVTDVSKPEDGNREQRKALDREHLRHASPEAKTIKLADLIDNTSSIVNHDADFAKVYLREKELLLPFLRDGDRILFKLAYDILDKAKIKLEKTSASTT